MRVMKQLEKSNSNRPTINCSLSYLESLVWGDEEGVEVADASNDKEGANDKDDNEGPIQP